MDMFSIVQNIFAPILGFFKVLFIVAIVSVTLFILLFLVCFFIKYRVNPFKIKVIKLKALTIKYKYYDLMRWLIVDLLTKKPTDFNQYGFTFYVGRQGAGKTISMVEYLNRMHERYPKALIVTNFKYSYSTHILNDWNDFLNIRNGVDGVIFAIDEIHSEYSSDAWKDFPESLLSEISQQRKQRIKIVATSQVFTRIAKPLREQAFSVVTCCTYFKRFVTTKCFDAIDYSSASSMSSLKKIRPLYKYSFIQSDFLRLCYDTYEKIQRMKKIKFIPRNERGNTFSIREGE